MLFADITGPIAFETPGCPEFTIERVLRDVVRALYLDNAIWLHRDTAANIEADGTLSLALPANSEVVAVRHIRTESDEITPRNIDATSYYDHDDAASAPVVLEENGVWRVLPAPGVVTPAKILLQLAPAYGATEIADAIGQRHRQLYEHAALARLLTMPGVSWADPGMANYHATAAAQRLFEAKRKADGWSAVRTPTVRYGGI